MKEVINKESTLKFTPDEYSVDYYRVEILPGHPLYKKFKSEKIGGMVMNPESLCPKSWISQLVIVDKECKIENSVLLTSDHSFLITYSEGTGKSSCIYDSYLKVRQGHIIGSIIDGVTINDGNLGEKGSELKVRIYNSKLSRQITVTPNIQEEVELSIQDSELNGSMSFTIEDTAWIESSNLSGSIIMGGLFPRLKNCNVVGPYIIRVEKDGLLENGVRDKFIEYEME